MKKDAIRMRLLWAWTAAHMVLTLYGALVVPAQGWRPALSVVLVLMAALSAVAVGVVLVTRRAGQVRAPYLLSLQGVQAVLVIILIAVLYQLPMPGQWLTPEMGLLAGLGLCSLLCGAGLCAGRMPVTGRDLRRYLGYAMGIPALVAFALSVWDGANWLDDIALSLGMGMLCAAALFTFRWLMDRYPKGFEAVKKPTAEAQDAKVGKKRLRALHTYGWLVAVVAILLPVLGLGFNAALDYPVGNFRSPWLYLLVILNGILMLPPVHERLLSPWFLAVKSVGFAVICYFTLVFLPLIPIGVMALVYYLIGLLVLTPPLVFVLELPQMIRHMRAQRAQRGPCWTYGALAAGLLCLPVILGVNAGLDRMHYQRALDYIEQEAPEEDPHVDTARLSRVLTEMDSANESFGRDWNMRATRWINLSGGSTVPIVSGMYRSLVFENVLLSQMRVQQLYTTFFDPQSEYADGSPQPDLSSWGVTQEGFRLKSLTAQQMPVQDGDYTLTWVNLEIENTLRDSLREYDTAFVLPQDCFIVDYYLWVGLQKKQGLLSERRAAEKVYNTIVSQAKDPGLLRYEDVESLSLRVFPFSAGEVRTTGFLVMHTKPTELAIGGQTISLETNNQSEQVLDLQGHSNACTAESCGEILSYTGDAYTDAARLMHNTYVSASGSRDVVRDAFQQRVLTPRTAFIVLETAQQEAALLTLQERIMNGEDINGGMISMDEPLGWLALAALLVLCLWKKKRTLRAQ